MLPRQQAVYDRGYLSYGIAIPVVIDATGGDSVDNVVALEPGTSLIYGKLTSSEYFEDGEPLELSTVEIRAIRYEDGAAAFGVTDGRGKYWLNVGEGHWSVFAYPFSVDDKGHAGVFPTDIYVGPGRTAIRYDFTARPSAADFESIVRDADSQPIGLMEFLAINVGEGSTERCFGYSDLADGFLSFDLPAGTWAVFPKPVEAARRGLLFKDLPILQVDPVDEGEDIPNVEVDIGAVSPTASITLTVDGAAPGSIEGVRVHAMATIGGSGYHCFGAFDAGGAATLPVIDGDWHIHLSDANLRGAGYLELPGFDLTVDGGDVSHAVTVTPKANSLPSLTLSRAAPGGELTFTGAAEPGQRYAVEGSTDLVTWRSFGRVIAEDGQFTITSDGPEIGVREKQFIRVRNQE